MSAYRITHRTAYSYSSPVVHSRHLLFLAPRETPTQDVARHGLLIQPIPAAKNDWTDYFGNRVVEIMLEAEHQEMSVTATSDVMVRANEAPALDAGPAWELLAERRLGAADGFDRSVLDFAVPSRAIPSSLAARKFALETIKPGAPILEAAQSVMTRIFEDFNFDPSATSVSTPVEQVLEQRSGVCQDFAQVAISTLRALGLPARYVSGYIRTIPPEGQERLVGADASHAWFSVWAPEIGWVDFDPTNNLINSPDHVTVAYGRDFDDVSPISGVLLGGGDHSVAVSVDVAPEQTSTELSKAD
ncbi:MAG: transglutaminase family protein [Neomegalonema sp.]|nr:transglutaminase family protein [Neomegalonema sp.]